MHVRGSVLVVDDEPTIREVVSAYLQRAGYETRSASDGFAAMDAVGERSPDLIVLDLMLPGLDGLEVMRRVRERPDRKSAIILLTAKGAEADRVIGLRLGADDYVVKPFSPAELAHDRRQRRRDDRLIERREQHHQHQPADHHQGPAAIEGLCRHQSVVIDADAGGLGQMPGEARELRRVDHRTAQACHVARRIEL
jgi:DNA-binding response OmpR family regulator